MDIKNPNISAEQLVTWFYRLVDLIDMKILLPPSAAYCYIPGNEGITGIACLETSHCSIHVWENYLQFDLYSCKSFDIIPVIRHFAVFEPEQYSYMLIDRNEDSQKVVEQVTRENFEVNK